MRITCPNCNAQYEVGDDMIPSEGRDVQCSNCGTTWFQDGRPRVASAVEERAIRRPGRKAPPPPPEDFAQADDADFGDAESDAADTPGTPRRSAKPRRAEPDQATLDILREERALEERLRASGGTENAGAERDTEVADVAGETASQGTPYDPSADSRQQAATERERMAAAASFARARAGARGARAARGTGSPPKVEADLSDIVAATMRDAATPPPGDVVAVATASEPVSARSARRELLPDIEEINSSLRPDERAAEAEADEGTETEVPTVATHGSGFRIGFLTVCLMIALLVVTYVFAGQIAEAVPQVAPTLTQYVAWVDTQRVALAAAAEALTQSIAPDR